MRVVACRGVPALRPPCIATVRLAAGCQTNSARSRIEKARKRGLPPDQCAVPADYLVDGQPMCRHHAGGLALTHLEEATR